MDAQFKRRIKTKRIFDKNVAQTLMDRGCKVVRMENHKDIENWIIFHFLDDKHFRQQLSYITLDIRRAWNHKHVK